MSGDPDLVDNFGSVTNTPAWVQRRMQRLIAANAHDATDARILLAALDLDRHITAACVECGNDDPCHGHPFCSDCLESQP